MSDEDLPDLPDDQDPDDLPTKRGDFVDKRKRRFDDIKLLCKNNAPIHLEKLLSIIEIHTGMTRKTASGLVMPLCDCGILVIDQDNIVRLKQ